MKDHRDPNDILREEGGEALRAEFDSMKPFEQVKGSNGHRHHNGGDDFGATQDEPPLQPERAWRENIFTAATLRAMQFKVIQYVVPGLFPEGLTILAGKPTIGKSWLALDIALAVAGGRYVLGDIQPTQGDVLYAALEDNQRRLWKRIRKIMGGDVLWPKSLTLATRWRRLDAGGIDDIKDWAKS